MQTAVSWPVFLTFITRQIRLPQSGGWSYAGKELSDDRRIEHTAGRFKGHS